MLSEQNIIEINDIIEDYAEQLENGDVYSVFKSLDGRKAHLLAEFFLTEAKLDLMLVVKELGVATTPIVNVSAEYNDGNVTVPNNCVIHKGAFYKTKVVNLVVPGSAHIEEGAFRDAGELVSATIGEGVKMLPVDCFINCKSLKKVNLPNTLKGIDDHAFMGCDSLTEIDLPRSLVAFGNKVFWKSENDMGTAPEFHFDGDFSKFKRVPEAERDFYAASLGGDSAKANLQGKEDRKQNSTEDPDGQKDSTNDAVQQPNEDAKDASDELEESVTDEE